MHSLVENSIKVLAISLSLLYVASESNASVPVINQKNTITVSKPSDKSSLRPFVNPSLNPSEKPSLKPSLALNQALETAVKKGQIAAIKKFLLQGADPNYKTPGSTHDPLIWIALSKNQPRVVKLLLKAGATADVSDHRGTPILIGALSLAGTHTTRETPLFKSILGLLKKGHANPNAQDKAYVGDSRGPLHMAVSLGSLDLVQLLLDFGANPNQGNRSKETALHFAAERGYTDIVQLLLARGALKDAVTKHTRMTPLLAAAENGHAQVVSLLIAQGANLGARDAFGKTASMLLQASAERHHIPQTQLAQTEEALRVAQPQ